MHYWGDDWFKQYGDQLYEAIDWITHRLIRARIKCYTKEKYGEFRIDLIEFWDGGLYSLFFKNRYFVGTLKYYKPKFLNTLFNFFHNCIYWFDYRIIPYKKTQYGWLKWGFADFMRLIGIVKLVQKLQAKSFNKTMQLACKKWPDIQTELLIDVVAMTRGIIKPCKWGDIDGDKLYKQWWKSVNDI